MNNEKYTEKLFDFIRSSASAFHTTDTVRARLVGEGYTELYENDEWELKPGGKYFVTRNDSSIIAFRTQEKLTGFVIAASHSDFCSFRVKMSSDVPSGAYTRVPVEKYGGLIMYSWFDRPLSVAGRVVVKDGDGARAVLVNVNRDLLVIPSVAIHMNRTVNEKFAPNPAKDLIPLFSAASDSTPLMSIVAEAAGVSVEDIISHDLFLYVRDEGRVLGADSDLILSPRIDNIASVFASVEAFLSSTEKGMTPVLAVFDNEEVGSATKQGAAATFLNDTLERIAGKRRALRTALATSYMASIDNAHAVHPNHPELADPDNSPVLNGGIVIKHNASQKYTTDAVAAAVIKTVADACGVKTQNFYNRADMLGGSTLGSIANTKVGVSTVDIGIPQLAMHSAVETAGAKDICDMVQVVTRLYSSEISIKGRKIVIN